MPFRAQSAKSVRLRRYNPGAKFPELLSQTLQGLRIQGKLGRVAVMVDDEEAIKALSDFDLQWLDPEEDYQWSGWLVQKKVRKPPRRIIAGSYLDWFQWFMRSQRFRTFHAVVLVEPFPAILEKECGGYVDGMLTRLMVKERQIVVMTRPGQVAAPWRDERGTQQVLRALLYGTRLSKPALFAQTRLAFGEISEEIFGRGLRGLDLHLTKSGTRYQLDAYNEELLQGAVFRDQSEQTKTGRTGQAFRRVRRFTIEAKIPDSMLAARILGDVGRDGWVTVPTEARKLSEWLRWLNAQGDSRMMRIYESNEDMNNDEWERLLAPRGNQVRRVLNALVVDAKLERSTWYMEIGRPALAYVVPSSAPFLSQRCGQCTMYVPDKRRCRVWWLANKTAPFFHPRWKLPGSKVTAFELHKMEYASRIGPRSSACLRFLDKKRDHLRGNFPEKCEICGGGIPVSTNVVVTCQNCKTRYVRRWDGRVRVLTAYQHEFDRVYREATGGDPKADLEAWKKKAKEDLLLKRQMLFGAEELDALAEEALEPAHEPQRIWLSYSPSLQEKVDRLARTTDITRQMSISMVQSASNATRRIVTFAKLYSGDANPLLGRLEMYLALMAKAPHPKFLPYEALSMKQYWMAYGLALRGAQLWAGPRKRSRFVTEFVEDPAGKARGYSPVDAAINYLHQRRLHQAERTNHEIGFPGTSDGFLHRERHNSRKIGLLLDMIDPFKFADREELLLVILDQGLTWQDFRIETDRRGSNYYYPMVTTTSKLDQVGVAADSLVVRYQDRDMKLSEAFEQFAENLLHILDDRNVVLTSFNPFVFGFRWNK